MIVIHVDTLMTWTIDEVYNKSAGTRSDHVKQTAWSNLANLDLVFNATVKEGKLLDMYIESIVFNDYVII